ncbi:MAG: PTS sugar transporter subunit IIA [Phycisphaerae bacterium]|nr:MAG: PTS sugar transporter subunit IIA [Planctomycetota bacterium]KAB2945842.1 MAG: PTS sugar transporter subunit IIA [Phycisphaerae bacterium]MBE7455888.1 PTS sugar transporter subunit IIA [Planctomycetia bacterium]MCK6465259.1 PTS sugar transporter subunit IIA [Phycisphaerae bacterium]MCL4717146.1 PTS sugar transporter subunit IIA [Phycisphaerae bacterium]
MRVIVGLTIACLRCAPPVQRLVMLLSQLLDPRCILIPTRETERFAVIRELVDTLAEAGLIPSAGPVCEAVIAREQLRSTGIGYGLAVPHAKSADAPRLLTAVGKPAQPVDFKSVDGRPCELVILLVSPPHETTAHVQALARISRMWLKEPFRVAVRAATDAASLLQAVREQE